MRQYRSEGDSVSSGEHGKHPPGLRVWCPTDWVGGGPPRDHPNAKDHSSNPERRLYGVCNRYDLQECSRKVQIPSMAKPAVQRPQEGLNKTTSHPRPICPQQVDPMPEIQNDNSGADSSYAAKRRIHLLYRSKRRILACANQSFRPYLGFRLGRVPYRFKVMPFGLNIAPRVFTKLVRVILRKLRSEGIVMWAYLDDWLIWGRSVEQCKAATRRVVEVAQEFGFLINQKKSRFKPQETFNWLGLKWSLSKRSVSLTKDFRVKVVRAVRSFRRSSTLTRRELERLLGLLLFASIVDPILKTRLKDLNKVLVSKARRHLRDLRLPMKRNAKSILKPWATNASLKRSVPLVPPPISMTIHTNASLEG